MNQMEQTGFAYFDTAGHDVAVCTLKFAGTATENIQDGVLERVEWSAPYGQPQNTFGQEMQ